MENRKIVIVLPAYNAGRTLAHTISFLPKDLEAEILLVDDNSIDDTLQVAKNFQITAIKHDRNLGYGANQKTCYREALKRGASIVVMVHPDGQYDPRMLKGLLMPIELDICDVTLGNRVRGRRETLASGMPLIKYIFNRILTLSQNIIFSQNLGEFLTGYRAYSRKVLETLDFEKFSNDFVFDSEFLAAAVYHRFRIGDVPVPTIYNKDSSQIRYLKGAKYILETMLTVAKYIFHRLGLVKFSIFSKKNN